MAEHFRQRFCPRPLLGRHRGGKFFYEIIDTVTRDIDGALYANNAALKKYNAGAYQAAYEGFLKAYRLDPRNIEHPGNVALALLRLNRLEESIGWSRKTITLIAYDGNPDRRKERELTASAWYNIGKAYEQMGDRRNALDAYRRSVEVSPNPARSSAISRLETHDQDRNNVDDASQSANTDKVSSVEDEINHFKQRLTAPVSDSNVSQQGTFSITVQDNSQMDFVWIPPTTSAEWKARSGDRDYFLMGDGRTDHSPYRFVRLDYGFFIARTEITRDQWHRLMDSNPWKTRAGEPEHDGNLPVNSVSWSHAAQYISKFNSAYPHSQLELFHPPAALNDYVFRMPTEAEWEYAARAGMLEPGEKYLAETAWYANTSKTSQPVASKNANAWNIYDMLGNVFELTADCWPTAADIKFGDPAAIRTNPAGAPNGVNSRGGAWYSSSHVKSFGWRSDCNSTGYHGDHLGMRLVLAPRLDLLNQAPQEQRKPESLLLKDVDQPLELLEKRHCDGSFRITDATITQEYDDRIVLHACYAYRGDKRLSLSAITYADGENTGKWGYGPGYVEPGTGCTKLEVSKNSLFAYDSDALLISSDHNRCEHMFYFEKHWTDGTDEK